MKKVEIITPNGHLTDIHNVLTELNVGGMSHYGIEGTGRLKVEPIVGAEHPTPSRPEFFRPEYLMRHKVEVVVKDAQVEPLIKKVEEKLNNEPQGGKIFVTDIPLAVDISTDKRGEEAI